MRMFGVVTHEKSQLQPSNTENYGTQQKVSLFWKAWVVIQVQKAFPQVVFGHRTLANTLKQKNMKKFIQSSYKLPSGDSQK